MGLDRKALVAVLTGLDANAAERIRVCLIGSSAAILIGQESRQTEDIDVWAVASSVKLQVLQLACEAAGVAFDPKDEFPGVPYLQIVRPGIVQVPGWDAAKREWFGEAEQVVWQGERLTVVVPPARVLAASKLVRGQPQDLEDCLWLMAAHGLDADAIMGAIKAMPRLARRSAEDNLAILNLIKP